MDIFLQAKAHITESLIRQYFDCEKSKVLKTNRGPELMTLCPFRQDEKVGSFFINLKSGMWIEKSDAAGHPDGDFIKLVTLAYNLSNVEAAKKIIKDSGDIVPDNKPPEKEKPKPKALIPIPEKALEKLEAHVNSKWIVENYGEPKEGTEYRNKQGYLWMCVVRHKDKDGGKNDVPYKFCEDQKWHAGNPLDKKRPLLGIDKLSDKPILIVEGEKCQKAKVEGYDLISWVGGTGQTKKSDWKSLQEYPTTIFWPDCDHKYDKDGNRFPDYRQPGMKAALYVQEKLPQTKILNVYEEEHPDTWDIVDAERDGIGLVTFIETTPEYKLPVIETPEISASAPFKFLGFDDGRHYFIPNGSNIVKKISFGSFSVSKLLELASLSFWEMSFPQKTGFNLNGAIDYIIRESESKGFFMPDNVRGAGVWFDEKRIIVNNGKILQDCNNKKIKMSESKYHYVMSDKKMGDLSGKVSTTEQGQKLIELFISQGFETDLEALIVLGWSLMAPFGGILKWRPHIWITGPLQTGKSYLLENLIHPLTGPFAFVGTGKDSAAGLYRALWKDPCPIIKDEMEPGKDDGTKKRIDEILDTARNASNDFSSYKTIANQHGGVDKFCIRSMFCFSSVVPYFTGAAIESRILTCRLKNLNRAPNKKSKTLEILSEGVLDDPGLFRRKIFKNLKNIISNIEILKKIIREIIHDDRKADNYSPIFAGYFSLSRPELPEKKKLTEYLENILSQIDEYSDGSDEDKLLKIIFDYHLKLDSTKIKAIAELIIDNENSMTEKTEDVATMNRNGIRFYIAKDETVYLAIARDHSQLKKILSDTIYSGRYEEVLKRHEFAENNYPSMRFSGTVRKAILLNWDKVKKKYFDSEQIIEKTEVLWEMF